ncbi:hypothetical protein [Arthrobacter sp. MMS24-S77]
MARDIGEQMILAEWLFAETLDDIRRRSQEPTSRTRYELLGIAPLLRKLLIDGTSLLDTVFAVRAEVPVEFRIRSWSAFEDRLANEGLSRYFGIGGEQIVGEADWPGIPLDEFLRTVIGVAETDDLTVKSVIRYYAHVEGGVHFGKPKEPGEPTLSSMSPMLLGHSTGQIQILAHLGQIVVDALEPVRRSIIDRPTIHKLWHPKNEQGRYLNHWTTEYLERATEDQH